MEEDKNFSDDTFDFLSSFRKKLPEKYLEEEVTESELSSDGVNRISITDPIEIAAEIKQLQEKLPKIEVDGTDVLKAPQL